MLTSPGSARLTRAARFGAVGAVGLVVNLGAQAALIEGLGVNYLVAAVVATQVSSTVNFALAESWVFGAGARPSGRAGRYVAFLAMNNVALLLRGPIMWMLTSGLGVHYAVSNLTSLVVLTLIRFGIADAVIWRVPQPPARDAVLGTRHPRHSRCAVQRRRRLGAGHRTDEACRHLGRVPPAQAQLGGEGQGCRGPHWPHSRCAWSAPQCSGSSSSALSGSTVTRRSMQDRARPCSASVERTSTSRCSAPIPCCCSPSSGPASGSSARATSRLGSSWRCSSASARWC